jgi:glycerate 2-kinase
MTVIGPHPVVVLAPDKFAGSLSAGEVRAALEVGLKVGVPDTHVVHVPVADGGEGTLEAALAAGYESVELVVAGPSGTPITCAYARDGARAVVELAAVCGRRRTTGGPLDPLRATTYGLGEVIARAVGDGCRQLTLTLGGSLSTDGGLGMLEALGARVRSNGNESVGRGGLALATVDAVDLMPALQRLEGVELVVAADVDAPLLGVNGAAHCYGPQKGATPNDVAVLEDGMHRWSLMLEQCTGRDFTNVPGAGAAGGTGFAALHLGGHITRGADIVLDLIGFSAAVCGANLVVTGEGSMDRQTLTGKLPAAVSERARHAAVPAIGVAGVCTLGPADIADIGMSAVYRLSDLEPDRTRSMANAASLVTRLGEQIARDWLV